MQPPKQDTRAVHACLPQAGVGGVVPGWEDGVASMQLGESARLNIPWKYACKGMPPFDEHAP